MAWEIQGDTKRSKPSKHVDLLQRDVLGSPIYKPFLGGMKNYPIIFIDRDFFSYTNFKIPTAGGSGIRRENQLRLVVYLIIHLVFYIPGGFLAGFHAIVANEKFSLA